MAEKSLKREREKIGAKALLAFLLSCVASMIKKRPNKRHMVLRGSECHLRAGGGEGLRSPPACCRSAPVRCRPQPPSCHQTDYSWKHFFWWQPGMESARGGRHLSATPRTVGREGICLPSCWLCPRVTALLCWLHPLEAHTHTHTHTQSHKKNAKTNRK